jgi:hypothetical protein
MSEEELRHIVREELRHIVRQEVRRQLRRLVRILEERSLHGNLRDAINCAIYDATPSRG